MISILLTPTDSKKELEKEYDRWIETYKIKPAVIVAHENIHFAFPEQDNSKATWYKGIQVISLIELYNLNKDNLLDYTDGDE